MTFIWYHPHVEVIINSNKYSESSFVTIKVEQRKVDNFGVLELRALDRDMTGTTDVLPLVGTFK